MIRGRRLCALVPARGGSKGIPRKNLYKIGDMTLVELALQLGERCASVDKVYVSTDDAEIQAIAVAHGCATPSLRPAALSTDTARTIDVIRHLVAEDIFCPDDCVLLLQPTSPLRTAADVNAICALFESRWEEADAIVSVCEIDGPHPYKAQVIHDGYLQSLLAQESSVPRQILPLTFMPNGAFYLGKVAVLDREDSFIPARSLPFLMPSLASVNLDSPLDLVLLEALIAKGAVRFEDGAIAPQPDKHLAGQK